jgi:3-hydroxyisobutyrate dehydrogenase-like beta-hydroxyacid dehydrogenase
VIVGLLHPGEMGSAVGNQLVGCGHEVVWASEGRSEASRKRAARFRDLGTVRDVAAAADAIVSLCPPHAAVGVAQACAGFEGIYVDANAISPSRAQEIAVLQQRFVDGGIVGGPPTEPGTTLYLSGADAASVASLFDGSLLEARVVSDASAVKMAYAAWTKGTTALLLAIREVAAHFGVEDEWRHAAPQLADRLPAAEAARAKKGWRWVGEMEEISRAMAAHDLPAGFHTAAAEVFRSRS